MLILVTGTDEQDIEKAVETLVVWEKGKAILKFKDIIDNLKEGQDLPDVNDSIILLDYLDILARNTSTKKSKLMTYMIMQSRRRNNIFIARTLDWKNPRNPNIDKRIIWMHEILVTAGQEKMVLEDKGTNVKKILTYEDASTLKEEDL